MMTPVGPRERGGLRARAGSPGALCSAARSRGRERRLASSIPSPSRRPRWRRPCRRCPAATSRRSCWPGRCCPSPRFSSPTSRPRASTSGRGRRSTGSCARSRPAACRSSSPPPTPRNSKDCATASSSCRAGSVVETFVGDEITEERIIHAAVRATGHARDEPPKPSAKSLDAADAVPPGRLRAGADPRPRDARPRRLHLQPQRPLPDPLQHHVDHDVAARRSGFIALGQTVALLIGGHRPVGRAAGRLPRGRRLASSSTTASRRASMLARPCRSWSLSGAAHRRGQRQS